MMPREQREARVCGGSRAAPSSSAVGNEGGPWWMLTHTDGPSSGWRSFFKNPKEAKNHSIAAPVTELAARKAADPAHDLRGFHGSLWPY